MNIKMLRDGDTTTAYLVSKDGVVAPFDYVSMIKLLYSEKTISDIEFDGEFSDDEKSSIKQMIDNIEKTVIPT